MALEIPETTLAAARRSRDDLRVGRPDERGMAAFAERALFSEALLAAIRARLNELRGVAK